MHDFIKAKKYATKLHQMGNDRGCVALLFFHLHTKKTLLLRNADEVMIELAKEVIQKSKKESADSLLIDQAALMLSGKAVPYGEYLNDVIKPDFEEAVRLILISANRKYATQHPLKWLQKCMKKTSMDR